MTSLPLKLPFSGSNVLNSSFETAFHDWKAAPSPHTSSRVLEAMDPVIDRAVGANVGASNPILKGHARRLALDSLASYDPKRSSIQTHLTSQFQQLKRYARRQTEPVAVPERLYYNSLHLQQASKGLEDQLGREPTLSELADHTGMGEAKIRRLRRGTSSRAEGALPHDPETGEPLMPGVSTPTDERLTLDLLLEDLPATDQKIVEWTLGLNGHPRLSNQEVARRLSRSPGLISQRKRVLQQQLSEVQNMNLFGGNP